MFFISPTPAKYEKCFLKVYENFSSQIKMNGGRVWQRQKQDKLWQVGILSPLLCQRRRGGIATLTTYFGPKCLAPFSFITSSFHSGAKMHKKRVEQVKNQGRNLAYSIFTSERSGGM